MPGYRRDFVDDFDLVFDNWKGCAGMDFDLYVVGIHMGFVDIGCMVLDKGSDFVAKDFVGMNCHFEPHFEQFLPFQLCFEDQWLLLLPLLLLLTLI